MCGLAAFGGGVGAETDDGGGVIPDADVDVDGEKVEEDIVDDGVVEVAKWSGTPGDLWNGPFAMLLFLLLLSGKWLRRAARERGAGRTSPWMWMWISKSTAVAAMDTMGSEGEGGAGDGGGGGEEEGGCACEGNKQRDGVCV